MHPQTPPGYLSTLEEIDLPRDGVVRSIWPSHWAKMTGSRIEPMPGAPEKAFILPVHVLDLKRVPGSDFFLRTERTNGATEETILPDIDSPAHVARWMAVEHFITDRLLVRSTDLSGLVGLSQDDPPPAHETLVCWFFYPNPHEPVLHHHCPRCGGCNG